MTFSLVKYRENGFIVPLEETLGSLTYASDREILRAAWEYLNAEA